ncbi:hypothetical protein [Pseudomonas sp. GOM6]|uniref:hypothetical protein n=1 Tax=Pseudomonas sp. GOM6 TaxID=3036944 RepID=UPI002409F860|nr:hypothetical protein [Pseudomonas sp. GOM6]MDG1581000.1 hypothetical protein [Pseudomonas sp. GOM6]
MKKKAYGLGVFGFGMVAVGQMAPGQLDDAPISGWQFVVVTLLMCATFFCAYKSFGMKEDVADTPS